jgi:putative transposase
VCLTHGPPPAAESLSAIAESAPQIKPVGYVGISDFFSTDVWTWYGLVTYYVLFFIRLGTREVHVAGITLHPDQHWMAQMARNVTMAEWGLLSSGHYLIHDRDGNTPPRFSRSLLQLG